MDERLEFIADWKRQIFSFAELCRRYGISRKTGHKFVGRYVLEGSAGLADRRRTPKSCPHQTPEDLVAGILEARRRHPTWGAPKLRAYLERRAPGTRWPAVSTIGEILLRRGLTRGRRRRRKPGHPGKPQTPMELPNAVWTIDFKGHFRTRDGRYCYPLTVVDGFSRYLLGCRAQRSTTHEETEPHIERLLREYGLPDVIRSDNGVPFATQAIGRISRLHVKWIKLGIRPELIEPSHPEQNGRHERMHRTLKAETTRPPASSRIGQQRKFDRFRLEYNEERPHEALDNETPASVYEASPRAYPARIPSIEYPEHFEIRRVSRNGGIRWKHHFATGPNNGWVNVSQVLAEEYVGLEEVDDGIWSMYFGPVLLGRFDEREGRLYGTLYRKRKLR